MLGGSPPSWDIDAQLKQRLPADSSICSSLAVARLTAVPDTMSSII
jgi:hypothetical protein